MSYTHLDQAERYQIYSMIIDKQSIAAIALSLDRHESSIRREIKRNKGLRGYRPNQAQVLAEARGLGSRNAIRIGQQLWLQVEGLLRIEYSPEQIAGCLPISHESIYQRIYADKSKGLYQHLRCQKKRRKRYGSGRNLRGLIPNRRGIEERCPSVETRSSIGHWEADTLIGKNHKGAIVSIVERKSGFTLIKKVERKTADMVSKAMIALLKPVKQLTDTITCDNGLEFAKHEIVDAKLKCKTYFARPYASWQRGTNENTNGLIRQYVPKCTKFESVSNATIAMIQERLNHRPRKRLGFKTPHQVFYAL